MAALSTERSTVKRSGEIFSRPVEAATKVYAGGLACLNAAGNAVPGSTATTLRADGVFQRTVDNTLGSAGALTVDVEAGIFRFDNSSGGDAIVESSLLLTCYIVDDHTVALTSGGSTRSVAGKIVDIDAYGVWVEVGSPSFPIL